MEHAHAGTHHEAVQVIPLGLDALGGGIRVRQDSRREADDHGVGARRDDFAHDGHHALGRVDGRDVAATDEADHLHRPLQRHAVPLQR